jgi:glycosyltransferase involved in cell wall biosynthesis
MSITGKKIAIFMSFSGDGGVERMMINLMQGLVAKHYAIDLVLAKATGSFVNMIPAEINVIRLDTSHTYTSLFALMHYLKRTRPPVLLVAKHRAGLVAAWARRLTGIPNHLVLRLGTTVSAALQGKSRIRHLIWHTSMRTFYPWLDKIIAVSEGVAGDIIKITGLTFANVEVIHNPVVTPVLASQALQPLSHPWFHTGSLPVIMGVGRLTLQKDFPTLIRAFAKVQERIPSRLMILGEGGERQLYTSLATELGIADSLELPGFVANPYAYLARAGIFVLSSRWEGSPNALTEAMALGIPVVATDCPSGPREILQDGRYGKLVPVGDVNSLAAAIVETLKNPPSSAELKIAVSSYTVETSTLKYLQALGD